MDGGALRGEEKRKERAREHDKAAVGVALEATTAVDAHRRSVRSHHGYRARRRLGLPPPPLPARRYAGTAFIAVAWPTVTWLVNTLK